MRGSLLPSPHAYMVGGDIVNIFRAARCWGLGMNTYNAVLKIADYELCVLEMTGSSLFRVSGFTWCVPEYHARQLAAESARVYGGRGYCGMT